MIENVKCVLCGGCTENRVLVEKAAGTPYNLVECCGCGLRYYSPGPSQNEIDVMTDSKGASQAHACITHGVLDEEHISLSPWIQAFILRKYAITHYRRAKKLLGDMEHPRVFEIGAGIGWFLHSCIDDGASSESIGCDPSRDAVQLGGAHLGVPLLFGDATESIPRLQGKFDIVIMNDVLEHMIDPVSVLFALREVCRDGAILYAKTFLDELDELDGRKMMIPPDHLIHPTRPVLKTMLDDAGWKIVEWEEEEKWSQVTIYAQATPDGTATL